MKISAFTFGGGFVIVPLFKKRFTDELRWIDEDEMLNLISIAQACPGAIAVNAAIQIGYRIGGFSGAVISALGTVIPPFLIILIISFFYNSFIENALVAGFMRGILCSAAALVINVAFDLSAGLIKNKNKLGLVLFILSFTAIRLLGLKSMLVLLAAITIGTFKSLLRCKK